MYWEYYKPTSLESAVNAIYDKLNEAKSNKENIDPFNMHLRDLVPGL
jgi:hypothetical protein